MPAPEPVEVRIESATRSLVLTWDDGVVTRVDWDDLHNACPSATCRGHYPGEVEPPNVKGITLEDAHVVGQYALRFTWSAGGCPDGIYTWQHLRGLGARVDAAAG